MKVALVPNIEKDRECKVTREAVDRLIRSGAEVYMTESGFGTKTVSEEEMFSLCDIIVTVGGDGTIIRYAKKAALHGKSVLGINAGRLGFLAQVEKDDLDLLDRLFSGNYTVSPRFMLKADVYENGEKYYYVLGDNANNSTDSRHFGLVPDSLVIGKATYILFSWDKQAKGLQKIRWQRIGYNISNKRKER